MVAEWTFDEPDNWVSSYAVTNSGVVAARQTREYTYGADGSVTMCWDDVLSTPVTLAR